ncbi:hypothetical protein F5Y08DRAFT_320925 [Xylaria arbuscula]|nr:hypothetical protein F5Y08DRAFT_320925 [Xylaria arbuscula]
MGVFARKSQSLDTRLQNYPDLQDLVARLLDILHHSLRQCMIETIPQDDGEITPITLDESQTNVNETRSLSTALKVIEDSLTRLNRLGVTIRQSCYGRIDMRVQQFAATLDLGPFQHLCITAVQILYPNAHQSLKDFLSKWMTKRYAEMLFVKYRQNKLKARRDPRTVLAPIPEDSSSELQSSTHISHIMNIVQDPVMINTPGVSTLPARSDLSSVNIQQIRSRPHAPDEASTKRYKTSSIQISRGNYPRPPITDGESSLRTCPWCFKLLDKTLSESDWRRHIDEDFKPYVCLAEECSQAHPSYPTFDEWFKHMGLHSNRWNERVYLTPSWVCTICEDNWETYNSPQALSSHIKECHTHKFSSEDIQLISRQSKTDKPRSSNECLLCHFVVDHPQKTASLLFPKREKDEEKQEAAKAPRRSLGMTNPNSHKTISTMSDSSSDSDDDRVLPRQDQLHERPRPVARHIATHLQTLMLLAIRFSEVNNVEEEPGDDAESNSVDIDEGNSSSEHNDLGRLSDVNSEGKLTGSDTEDIVGMQSAAELLSDELKSDALIPDTNLDFSDIPRQHDSLAHEKDIFLEGVLQSGAFRPPRDEHKDPTLKIVSVLPDTQDSIFGAEAKVEGNVLKCFKAFAEEQRKLDRERVKKEREMKTLELRKFAENFKLPTRISPAPNHLRRASVETEQAADSETGGRATVVPEKEKEKQKAAKIARFNELKEFATNFKLATPVPLDLVDLLSKDPDKQREIFNTSYLEEDENGELYLRLSDPYSPARERQPIDGYTVLWIAASLFEFNVSTTKYEAGYPYLTYQAGEIFDVIADKGELWLAKNQDDPNNSVGWIWDQHFAKLADDFSAVAI